MSITIPDNQPIYFDGELDALSCTNIPYIQLIENTDITQLQITLGFCSDYPEEIQSPDFNASTGWTLGAGWSIAAGVASITVAGGSSSLSQTALWSGNRGRGQLYRITVVVNSIDGDVDVAGATGLEVPLYEGTNTIYFRPIAAGGGVSIRASVGSSIELDSVRVVRIPSDVILSLFDENNLFIDQIQWAIATPTGLTESDPQLTFAWDWTTRANPDDCYYFCLHDPCTNTNGQNGLFNGEFQVGNIAVDDLPGFTKTLTAGVTLGISAGTEVVTFFSPGPIGSMGEALSDFTQLAAGITYDIEISITGATNASFRVQVGATTTAAFTGFGVHNTTLTPAATGFVNLFWEDTAGSANMGVEYVRITLNDGNDLVCNFTSNNVKVGTHDCTHLVSICGTENDLGFNFIDGFSPQLRLVSQIKGRNYAGTRITQRLSTGVRKMGYADGEISKNFLTDNIPYEELDFLYLTTLADQVFIDTIQYQVNNDPDDFEPQEIPQEDKLANVSLEIVPYDQEIENKNCDGSEPAC